MVRAFDLKDRDAIMEIWLHTNGQAHQFIPSSYWTENFEMVKNMLPETDIYVYEEETIKGFIGIINGYIAGLFVLEAEQSKGIGRQLLNAAQEKYPTLTLNVYEKNARAIHFYEKHGFKITGQSIDIPTNEREIRMMWESHHETK